MTYDIGKIQIILIRKMCYFFFMLLFSYQHQIISNTLGPMCTNERHTKKTFETELKNEGFNNLTSTKKKSFLTVWILYSLNAIQFTNFISSWPCAWMSAELNPSFNRCFELSYVFILLFISKLVQRKSTRFSIRVHSSTSFY